MKIRRRMKPGYLFPHPPRYGEGNRPAYFMPSYAPEQLAARRDSPKGPGLARGVA